MTLAYLQIRRIDYSCVATSAGIAMRLSEQAKWMVRNVYQANPSIRTAYPELFAVIGGKVPDYRGLFLRGYGQQTHTQNNGQGAGGCHQRPRRSGRLNLVWAIWGTYLGSREFSTLRRRYL